MYDAARMAPRSLVAVALCLGCASAAKPGTLYRKGVDAFEADDMQGAATALEAFVDKSCAPTSTDKRCREAYIKLGHAHERLGSPAGAWAAYDAALAFGPHTRDEAVKADLERTQRELAERKRSRRRPGAGRHPVPRRGRRRVQRALADRLGRLRAGRHARTRTRASCTAPTTAASGAARRPSAITSWSSRRCTTASRAWAAARARTCARPGRSRAPCTRPSRSRSAPTARTARATPPPTRPSTSAALAAPDAQRGMRR